MRVLIVDDAATERGVLARVLAALGHDVTGEAASLAAALASSELPDLVVVDGRLPGAAPAEAVSALRSTFPSARIAIIAALGEVDLVRAARAAGAATALQRPLLREPVREALAGLR